MHISVGGASIRHRGSSLLGSEAWGNQGRLRGGQPAHPFLNFGVLLSRRSSSHFEAYQSGAAAALLRRSMFHMLAQAMLHSSAGHPLPMGMVRITRWLPMVAKRMCLRMVTTCVACVADSARSRTACATLAAMSGYTAGWVTCHAAGPNGTAVGVKHRLWIYGDGRAFWSLCEVVEAFMADSRSSWWAEVKRMRAQWEAVFERLQYSMDIEIQRSMRQASHFRSGGLCRVSELSASDVRKPTRNLVGENRHAPPRRIHLTSRCGC